MNAATICVLGKALEMQGLVSPGAFSPRNTSVTPQPKKMPDELKATPKVPTQRLVMASPISEVGEGGRDIWEEKRKQKFSASFFEAGNFSKMYEERYEIYLPLSSTQLWHVTVLLRRPVHGNCTREALCLLNSKGADPWTPSQGSIPLIQPVTILKRLQQLVTQEEVDKAVLISTGILALPSLVLP